MTSTWSQEGRTITSRVKPSNESGKEQLKVRGSEYLLPVIPARPDNTGRVKFC